VIETELDWLNAPPGTQKTLSVALLALFPIVLLAGLWRRSRHLLAASAGPIVVFYFLMRRREALIGPVTLRPLKPKFAESHFHALR
jgi:hypothetical protein